MSYLRNFEILTASDQLHVDADLNTTSGSGTCLWLPPYHPPPGQALSFLKLWLSGAPSPSCIIIRGNLPDPTPLQMFRKPPQSKVTRSASPPEHQALILSSLKAPACSPNGLLSLKHKVFPGGSQANFHDTKIHAKA